MNIRNVSKSFASRIILRNINATFLPGEIIAIVGSNGCGKTTFLKLLCGLILPDSGTISINGLDIIKERLTVMSSLGIVLDGTRSLYWKLSAWQNFVYFAGLKGVFGEKVKYEGEKLLKLFGLWTTKNQKVESFSLGMKQKLSICCALTHNPDIILFDEPTTGLDQNSQGILLDLIKAKSSASKTILIATHDLELVQNICSRKIAISNSIATDVNL